MSITVKCLSGPKTGQEFSFDRECEFTFGRSPQSDCCMEGDSLVSRIHACFVVNPSIPSIGIKDLGSTNGFRINNVPTAGKASPRTDVIPLANGDEVMIGKTRMRVTFGEDEPESKDDLSSMTADEMPAFQGARRRNNFMTIPGYQILRQLGSGGMGLVFKARKTEDGSLAAIKVMTNNVVVDQKMFDMFQREIEVTRALRHPNIVRYSESGCIDSMFYLVIEFVDGGDLTDRITASMPNGMQLESATQLIRQIMDAMSYAHRKSLVHRDLKPSNILIDSTGSEPVAKIADLGLAKNFNNSGLSGVTSSFTRGGTMAYMPPEQLSEFRDVKPSADVFSLAATFYEMLSGKLVYEFKDGVNPFTTISDCRIKPILDLNPEVPREMAKIIDKALAKAPEERYPDAGFMLNDMYDHGIFE